MALRIATNPDTKAQVVLSDGQWLPVTRTATNASGEKAYLANGKWLTDTAAAPTTVAPAKPKTATARPTLRSLAGKKPYTGLDALVMAPFTGPKMEAFTGAMGQSIGNLLALGGDIVGDGVHGFGVFGDFGGGGVRRHEQKLAEAATNASIFDVYFQLFF